MKRPRHPVSLRVRLTLWYAGAMMVVLAVYAGAVFTFVSRNASENLDNSLRQDLRWPAEMLPRNPDGSIILPEPGEDSIGDIDSPWLQLWSSTGELVFTTVAARLRPIPETDQLAARADGSIVQIPQTSPPMRVLSRASNDIKVNGQPAIIQVAKSEKPIRDELSELSLMLLLGLPFGVVAAGLGGYSLARRALAPVDRMAERARSITAERLQDRLPVDNPNDELGRLASVFNQTLTRLEASFDQMRRFTADASHELRTPLTAIRTVGEVGLRGRRDEAAYREIIISMLEEVDRLSYLVDRLLTLSRTDIGQGRLSVSVIDLGDLADDVAGQLGVLAEEKQQTITVDRPVALQLSADPVVLRQAVLNLVDNAIKYTPNGGRITIRVLESHGAAILEVSDTGPGIPENMRRRIFDRFYRIDASGSRDERGTGLGLSIAKAAVESNGGQLTLEPTDGTGCTFRISVPVHKV
jgi:heavy metal sensor kinase